MRETFLVVWSLVRKSKFLTGPVEGFAVVGELLALSLRRGWLGVALSRQHPWALLRETQGCRVAGLLPTRES